MTATKTAMRVKRAIELLSRSLDFVGFAAINIDEDNDGDNDEDEDDDYDDVSLDFASVFLSSSL